MSENEFFTFEADDVIRDTDDAVLFRVSYDEEDLLQALDFERDLWVPKSQLCDGSEYMETGDSGEVSVLMWFARKNGWT